MSYFERQEGWRPGFTDKRLRNNAAFKRLAEDLEGAQSTFSYYIRNSRCDYNSTSPVLRDQSGLRIAAELWQLLGKGRARIQSC